MGGRAVQGEVILWCSVYEVYEHAVVIKILSAERQLRIPYMSCFLYLTYVYENFFVYVQLNK